MKANIIIRRYNRKDDSSSLVRYTIYCDDKDALIDACNELGVIVSMYIDDGTKKETNN